MLPTNLFRFEVLNPTYEYNDKKRGVNWNGPGKNTTHVLEGSHNDNWKTRPIEKG